MLTHHVQQPITWNLTTSSKKSVESHYYAHMLYIATQEFF